MRGAARLREDPRRLAFLAPGVSLNIASTGRLTLGRKVSIGKRCGISVGPGAVLAIGDRTDIQPNTRINAMVDVKIGSDCAISWQVDILDCDFHSLIRPDGSVAPNKAPVCIGDRVWIGTGVKILKGVTIGEDCVVAAGAVVTKSFPAHSLIQGVPAVRKGEVTGWR